MVPCEQFGTPVKLVGVLLIVLVVSSMEHIKDFFSTSGKSSMYRGTSHAFNAADVSSSSRARAVERGNLATTSINGNKEGKYKKAKWTAKEKTDNGKGGSEIHIQDDLFLPPIVHVTVSFMSQYSEPVIFVRVQGPGDAEHATSWFAPDTWEQLGKAPAAGDVRWLGATAATQKSEGAPPLTTVHFRIGFRPVAPEEDHMLHIRLEYKSRAESLFSAQGYSLTNTTTMAFVGKTLEGSPVTIVPKMWAGYAAPPPGPLPMCLNSAGAVGNDGIWQVGYSEKSEGGEGGNVKKLQEADADPAVKATCNSKNRPHTSNDMWGRRGCRMQRYDPRCLYDAGGLILAGDSVTRYMYYQLACELRALGASEYNISRAVTYSHFDGPVPNYLNLQIESVCHHMRDSLGKLRKSLPDLVNYMEGSGDGATQHGWQTLSINAGGLWQCTFGEDVLWKMYLHKVLDAALDAGFRRVLWISTTQVHPILYSVPKRKVWPLTKTRIDEVNAYALSVGRARGLEMIDFHLPSSLRETDPMEQQDMRHFGQNTMHELSQILLRATCSPPQDPDVVASEKAWKDRGEWHDRVDEGYFKKGSHQEDFDDATRNRPCYHHYFKRKVRAYMKPCASKQFPDFRGWQCPSLGDTEKGNKHDAGIVVGRGECLGDPVHLDTCDKIIDHGQALGRNGNDVGFIEPKNSNAFNSGDFNHADNHFKVAAGYCKCQPIPLPEWQKGYFSQKTGPFAEIDIENIIASNNKPVV